LSSLTVLSCMRTFIISLLAALTIAAAVAHADDQRSDSILVVGDSLSAGFGIDLDRSWVALLQDRLTSEGYGYRVVNASISGDTTTGGLRRLPRALNLNDPKIVVIELGGNDALRGTPIRIIRENLLDMIQLCKTAGARVILAGMLIPPNYGQAYTDNFERIYKDLSADHHVSLVPFFMENVALDPTLMQRDGIHPNENGQPFLMEKVWSVLQPKLSDFDEAAVADQGG